MNIRQGIRCLGLGGLLVAGSVGADTLGEPIAAMSFADDGVAFTGLAGSATGSMVLRISRPDGSVYVTQFYPGESVEFDAGGMDGQYSYELQAIPSEPVSGIGPGPFDENGRSLSVKRPALAQTAGRQSQWGYFSVIGGSVVDESASE